MRFAVPAILATLVAAALVAVGSAPAAAARCPKAGHTVARNADARVWRVRSHGPSRVDRFYGCARANGRVTRLDPRDGRVDGPPSTLALARAKVAYQTLDYDIKPFRVVVRSLRSGRILHRAFANRQHSEMGTAGPVRSVVVTPRGSVAWTATVDCTCEGVDFAAKGWEVHAVGRDDRPRLLDRGPEVQPGSLRLIRGARAISWRHGDATRTARLR